MRDQLSTGLDINASSTMAASEATAVAKPEQVVGMNTRLAIARWNGAIYLPSLQAGGTLGISPQAHWYQQIHQGLKEWIRCGGFAQEKEK